MLRGQRRGARLASIWAAGEHDNAFAVFVVKSLGETKTAKVTPVADPSIEIVRDETIGKKPSEAQLAFRNAWLGADGSMLPPKAKTRD
jgi:hypothetical protein